MLTEKQLIDLINSTLRKTESEQIAVGNQAVVVETDRLENSLKHAVNFSDQRSEAQKKETGLAWVENNRIYVHAVPGQHTLPMIYPAKGVDIYVNNKLIKRATPVSSNDTINVAFRNEKKDAVLKIKTDDSGLTAYMFVQPQVEKRYYLCDRKAAKSLILKIGVETDISFPFSINEILEKIKAAGVVHGLDYTAIQGFLAAPHEGRIVVANGVPPKEPVDDYVALLFEEFAGSSCSDSAVFKQYKIPSVDENNVIAVKHDGRPGQPGVAVTGEIIKPREPKRITLKGGRGVRIDDSTVFSTEAGRPIVKKLGTTWLFYIDPYYIHYGDINHDTGDCDFRGNITVFGDVNDGITLRAGGCIEVLGCINRANVVALESVKAGKCIASQIQAGGDAFNLEKCYLTLEKLDDNLKKLLQLVKMVLENPKTELLKDKLGYVVLVLIEQKLPEIPKLLEEALQYLNITPIDMPEEIERLINMIKRNVPPRNLTPEKLMLLIEKVDFALEFFGQVRNNTANVVTDYVYNSIIHASNDIVVTGEGCFASTLTAGGNVRISGCIRGGVIEAKGDIVVGECGTELGVKTVLKTAEDKKIRILSKAHDGVIINVGGHTASITKTIGPAEFYCKENKILVNQLYQ